MNIKSKSLSRRTALRGMGAMLTLPYLDIMGNKTLAAASNQSDPVRWMLPVGYRGAKPSRALKNANSYSSNIIRTISCTGC